MRGNLVESKIEAKQNEILESCSLLLQTIQINGYAEKTKEIVQDIMSLGHDNFYSNIGDSYVIDKYNKCENLPKDIDSRPELKKAILSILRLFLDKKAQEYYLPAYTPAKIQTMIRNYFLEHFKVLEHFSHIPEISKTTIKNALKNSGIPQEIANIIFSYSSLKSQFSLAQANKHYYFLHKNYQELIYQPKNMIYIIADELAITNQATLFKELSAGYSGLDLSLVKSIPNETVLHSLTKTKKESFIGFFSLYHALECARFLQHGGHFDRDDPNKLGYMPSVWAVLYAGNTNNLVIKEKEFIINKGVMGNYYCSERKVCAPFVSVSKGYILPVNGIVAYPVGDFSNYKLLGSFDFIKYIQKFNITDAIKENCSIQ